MTVPVTLRSHPIGWSSAFWAMVVSALWGGNVVALKLGLLAVPPFWSAFWRMLLGLAAIGAFAFTQRISLRLAEGELPRLMVLGLLFTAQISLLNYGAYLTSPAVAVVLLNSHPVFANLLGHFAVSEERLSSARSVGLVLALGGVAYVFLGTPDPRLAANPRLGNALLIGSALLLGARTLYTRRLVQSIDPTRAILWQVLISIPIFLVIAALGEPPAVAPVGWKHVVAIAYQGVAVAGVCFILWTLLLRKHPAGTLSMFAFTVPFFGVLLSNVLFGEPISARLLAGVALVTAGILVATRAPMRAATEARSQIPEA